MNNKVVDSVTFEKLKAELCRAINHPNPNEDHVIAFIAICEALGIELELLQSTTK